MKRNLLTAVLALSLFLGAAGQPPLGFNYQAVVRSPSGDVVANRSVSMRISIIHGAATSAAVYIETFRPQTNEFGLVNLVVGRGTSVSGAFASIDWSKGLYFLRVEIDVNGGTSYVDMGTTQLLSVPFANFAFSGNPGPAGASAYQVWLSQGNTGTEEQFLESLKGDGGSSAWADKPSGVTTTQRVGVGTETPGSRMVVQAQPGDDLEAPIFEVRDKWGRTVFAVFHNGTQTYLYDSNPDGSGSKSRGGFAVSGRTSTKGEFEDRDILVVTPEQTRIYVDEVDGKSRGGFAVSGRTSTKEGDDEILMVTPGLTQVFVDSIASPKSRGGFAVSGRTSTKGVEDIFTVSPELTQVLVGGDEGKSRGGFAVSGRTSTKVVEDILTVTPGLTQIFIPETTPSKSRGGFAVSGRTSTKSQEIDFLTVRQERTDIYLKPNPSKFFPDGFSISVYDEENVSEQLFSVSNQGTFVATALAVAPKVTTASPVTGITQISGAGGGQVIEDGGSPVVSRGLVYSSVGTPNVNIDFESASPSVAGIVHDWAMPEGGLGIFSGLAVGSEFAPLSPGVTYTVRAFATNGDNLTGYGAAVTFTTLPPDTLTLTVTRADNGQPVTNAVVTLHPFRSYSPIVHPMGSYKIPLAKGTHFISVRALGFETLQYQEVSVTGNLALSVSMVPLLSTTLFHIRDAAGNPVDSAEVIVDDGVGGMRGYTGDDGVAEVWNIPIGTFPFSLAAYGYERFSGSVTIASPGDIVTVNVTLTSAPRYRVTLMVLDPAGAPAAGAEVYLYYNIYGGVKEVQQNPPPGVFQGTTDALGLVTFESVPKGNYNFNVSHNLGWGYGSIDVDGNLASPFTINLTN